MKNMTIKTLTYIHTLLKGDVDHYEEVYRDAVEDGAGVEIARRACSESVLALAEFEAENWSGHGC